MPRPRKILLLPQAVEDLGVIYEPLRSAVIDRLRMLKRFAEMGAPLAGPFVGWR